MLRVGHRARIKQCKERAAARKEKSGGKWEGYTLAEAQEARAIWVCVKFRSSTLSKKDLSSQSALPLPHPPHSSTSTRYLLWPPLPLTPVVDPTAAPLSSLPLQRLNTLDHCSTLKSAPTL